MVRDRDRSGSGRAHAEADSAAGEAEQPRRRDEKGSWCLQRHERKHRQQNVYYAAHDDEQLLERLMLDDVPIEPTHRLTRDDDWRPRRHQQQRGASQGGDRAGAARTNELGLPPAQPPSQRIASHGEQRINDSRLPNGREHTSSTPPAPAEGGDARHRELCHQSGLAVDHEEQQQRWSQQLPPPPPPLPALSVQRSMGDDLAARTQEELDMAEEQAVPLAAQAETQQQMPMDVTLDDASTPQQAPAVQAHAEEQQQGQEGPESKPHDAVISSNGSAAHSTQAAEAEEAGDAANLADMDVVAAASEAGTASIAAAVTSATAAVPSSANTDSTAAPDAAGHAAVGAATEAYAALQHLLAPLQAQLTGCTQWAVESCRYSAHVAQRLDAHGAALLSHSGDLTELRRSIEKAVTASVQRDAHAAFHAYMTPVHAEVRVLRREGHAAVGAATEAYAALQHLLAPLQGQLTGCTQWAVESCRYSAHVAQRLDAHGAALLSHSGDLTELRRSIEKAVTASVQRDAHAAFNAYMTPVHAEVRVLRREVAELRTLLANTAQSTQAAIRDHRPRALSLSLPYLTAASMGHAAVGAATEAYAALQHLLAPLQAQLTGCTQWAVESCRYSAHVAQRLNAHGAALLSHSGDLTELRRSIEKAVTASVQRDAHAAFHAYMTPVHAEVRVLRREVAELRTLLANTAQSTQAAIRDHRPRALSLSLPYLTAASMGHAAVGAATEAYAALQHLLAPLQGQLTGCTQWAVESCRYSAHVAQRLDAHGAALLSHSGDLTELRRSIEKAVTASVQRDAHAAFNAYMTPVHAEVRVLRREVAELRTLLANTAQSTQAAIRDGVAAGVKAAASLQATDGAASAISDADVHAKQQHRLARAKEFAARLSPLSSQSQQQQATIIKQGDDDEFAMALEDASPALLRALQCSTAADGHATVYAAVAAISGHHSQSLHRRKSAATNGGSLEIRPLTLRLLRMRTRSHRRRMALLPALYLLSNLTPLSDWLLQQSQWTQWQPCQGRSSAASLGQGKTAEAGDRASTAGGTASSTATGQRAAVVEEPWRDSALQVLDRYRLHKIFTLPDRPTLLLAVAPALDLESLRRQVAAGKMHTAQEFMQWGEALLRVAGGHTVGLSEDGAAVCDAAAQLMRMFFQWLCLELLPMPRGGAERDAEEKAETMGPSTARMPSWRAALILQQQCADGAKQLRLLRSQRHKHRVLREALSAATEIESPAARGYARIVATLHAKAMAMLGLPHSVALAQLVRALYNNAAPARFKTHGDILANMRAVVPAAAATGATDGTAVSQRRELEVLIAGRYTFQVLEDVGVQLIVQQAKEASAAEQAARKMSPSPAPPPAAPVRPASASPRALSVSAAPPPSAATDASAADVDTAQLSAAPATPRTATDSLQQRSAGAGRRRAATPPLQPPTADAPANGDAAHVQQKGTPCRASVTAAEGGRDDWSPKHKALAPAAAAQRRGSSSQPTAASKDPQRSRTPSPRVPAAASTDCKLGDRAPSPTAAAAAAAEAESISDASTALERQSPPVEAAAAADDASSATVTPARGDAPAEGGSRGNAGSTHGGSGSGGGSGSRGIGLPPVYPRSASAVDADDGDGSTTTVETSSGRALTVHDPVPQRSPSPQLQGSTLPSRLWSLQSLLEGDALIAGAFLNIDFDKYPTYLDEVESPQDLRSASCCLRERLKPGGRAAEQQFAAVKYLLLLMEIVRNSRTFTGFTEGDSPSRAAARMEDLVRSTYTKQLAAFLRDAHRATLHGAGFPAMEPPPLPADADAEAEKSPRKHKRGRPLDSKNKASAAPRAALNGAVAPPPPADADGEEPPAKRKRGRATGATINGKKGSGDAAAATGATVARRGSEGGQKRPRDASEENSGGSGGGDGRSAPHGSSKVVRRGGG
ncbi:hypothetical protein JKP88DRAFT_276231 [Tribonema minus]|uniref:Uncharacterized protein n=1 Tax=Tribonema minus TaxID=303371 RepID=A0A836CHK1_9STRA|nr:hypothetical protein JKP88DRAFT_276231 [Tribonema minus]